MCPVFIWGVIIVREFNFTLLSMCLLKRWAKKIGFPVFASPVFSPSWHLWENSDLLDVFSSEQTCASRRAHSPLQHSVFGANAIPVFSAQNPCPDLTCTFGPWLLQSALHWPAERGKRQCGAENINVTHCLLSTEWQTQSTVIKVQSRCYSMCLHLAHLLDDPPNPMMATLDAFTVT